MKIQLLSDLHLEHQPEFRPDVAEGASVLVLAGDIGSYQAGSRLRDLEFGLARFSPLGPGKRWSSVLFVPGNHEYDGLEFEPTRARLRDCCASLGITWLDREVVVLEGVRFVGTTLWSDFDSLAARAMPARQQAAVSPLTWRLQQREKAFRAANFYLRNNSALRDGQRMLAADLRELALECQAWLRAALAVGFAGPTVVVSHFAPSLRSHDPRFGLTPGTAGFCNGLDDLFPGADVWMHGHLHCPSDYLAEGLHHGRPWRCRIVANPLGYAERREQEGFQPDFCVEVPVPAITSAHAPGQPIPADAAG